MRRTYSIILVSGLAALLCWTGLAVAQPADDDEGMTFEPDDINEPPDPGDAGDPEPIMGDDGDDLTFEDDDFSDEPEPEPEPDLEPEPGDPRSTRRRRSDRS